jgi:hypothetical protein
MMPAKKRTSKRKPDDELTWPQFMGMLFGDTDRNGPLWDSPAEREAAYWSHRDRILRGFPESREGPPAAVYDYEPPGGELHRAAVEFIRRGLIVERDRQARINAKHGWLVETPEHQRLCDLLDDLEGVTDARAAREISRRSYSSRPPMVGWDQPK